jgi:hypothetical protein
MNEVTTGAGRWPDTDSRVALSSRSPEQSSSGSLELPLDVVRCPATLRQALASIRPALESLVRKSRVADPKRYSKHTRK